MICRSEGALILNFLGSSQFVNPFSTCNCTISKNGCFGYDMGAVACARSSWHSSNALCHNVIEIQPPAT